MTHDEIIAKTTEFVRSRLEGEGTGHDWWHIDQVRKLALRIGQEEGADLFLVEIGALLHDVADFKFHGGDETVGPRVAREWLESIQVDKDVIDHICDIILHISFKGANVENKISTLEGKVVQDADRLEALGAIGIARCFAYGGSKGRPIYEPGEEPEFHDSFEAYKKGPKSSLIHFYEKILLLKDRMNTPTGRKIAEGRHEFVERFLEQFHDEWEGRA